MSSGVRPKLKSRSSLMSLSQLRMRCFAGSSLARTSLRTRLDRAFRNLAGRVATLCCEPSMVVIPSVFGTGSGLTGRLSWLRVTTSSPPGEIWVTVVARGWPCSGKTAIPGTGFDRVRESASGTRSIGPSLGVEAGAELQECREGGRHDF
jgi:hypothetical protein